MSLLRLFYLKSRISLILIMTNFLVILALNKVKYLDFKSYRHIINQSIDIVKFLFLGINIIIFIILLLNLAIYLIKKNEKQNADDSIGINYSIIAIFMIVVMMIVSIIGGFINQTNSSSNIETGIITGLFTSFVASILVDFNNRRIINKKDKAIKSIVLFKFYGLVTNQLNHLENAGAIKIYYYACDYNHIAEFIEKKSKLFVEMCDNIMENYAYFMSKKEFEYFTKSSQNAKLVNLLADDLWKNKAQNCNEHAKIFYGDLICKTERFKELPESIRKETTEIIEYQKEIIENYTKSLEEAYKLFGYLFKK